MHDWTLVPDGIFHAFHHRWISELARVLNRELLTDDLYALPEQVVCDSVTAMLTVIPNKAKDDTGIETDGEIYRRKKSAIVVRHVSGDRIVALIEIVSPGNKSGEFAIASFVRKACEFLERRVHLLILDPFPPGPRDPEGVHDLIWRELDPVPFHLPPEKSLTLVAYECDVGTRAYVEPIAVGDRVPDMPLFLVPDGCVMVPLEATYQAAFDVQPRRWQKVVQPAPA